MNDSPTSLREKRAAGVPRRRAQGAGALFAALAAGAFLTALAGAAGADPGPMRLSSLLDPSGISPAPLPEPRPRSEWVSIGGAEWGWWLWNRRQGEEAPGPEAEERVREVEEEDVAAYGEDAGIHREAGAGSTRIGIEMGGFLPFGAKEESFQSGQMCGVLLGFGLFSPAPGILVTDEIRFLEGTTSSQDQTSGYDVSSLVFAIKDDFLFHFFPEARGFNLHVFLGLSLGIERTTAKKGSLEDTATAFWFLADAGLGAWVTLAGPVDLLLRLEFDFIPTTNNIPFFAVGLMGLQVRF